MIAALLLIPALAFLLAAPAYAGTFPVAWTWPSTNADGSQLTDLDHGRMVLYRCVTDSIVRRTPPLKSTFVARRDSIVFPNIPATGLEGDSAAADIEVLDGRGYWLNLQAVDHSGNVSPINSLTFVMPAVPDTVIPPPPPDTSGTGITGDYYSGRSRSTWIATRRDTTINFAWGLGSPMPGVPVDEFSVQWTGKLVVPTSGAWTLYLEVDDGGQLYEGVPGASNIRIDKMGSQPLTEWSWSGNLIAGEHGLAVVFQGTTGNAECHLSWSGPGVPKQIVPRGVLR